MATKMKTGQMAIKSNGPGKGIRAKTPEQVQTQALARYNAKKESASGSYKTNAKGQLVLSDGRVVNYKGGKAPEKMKNANVSITRTLPEVTVKASRKSSGAALENFKTTASRRKIVNPQDLGDKLKNTLIQKKGYKMNSKGEFLSPVTYTKTKK